MTEGPVSIAARPQPIVSTVGPVVVPRQHDLFPISTVAEFPDSLPTADAWGTVLGVDGHSYVAKLDKGGRGVRASEWMGTHIAESANVPCPTPKIVELQNGELAFGSRRIAGAQEEAITAEILTRGVSVPGLTASLSSVFALDLFLNNVDRHDRNFLMVEDRGALRMYTFDFGRCLFYHGRLEPFPSKSHQTRLTATKLRRRHGFDLAAANSVLDRIMGLNRPGFAGGDLV